MLGLSAEDPRENGGEAQDKDIEEEVFQQWNAAEDKEPTDPYSVLRCPADVTPDQLRDIFKRRASQFNSRDRGVARLLRARFRRAAEILGNARRRRSLDESREERRTQGKWFCLQFPNGRYEGSVRAAPPGTSGFSEGMRHGKGITVLASCEKYEGAYRDDRRHGVGVQIWSNGDTYVGQWASDRMHGIGVYYYGSGPVYDGNFEGGLRHGRGRLRWRAGSSFVGQFVEDARSGHGVETVAKKRGVLSRYDGEWRNGRKHGRGTYESEEDGRYEGQFADDRFHGEGSWRLSSGDTYEGPFSHGKPHGSATYRWGTTGDSYAGEIRRGRLCGQGDFLAAGLTFSGQWMDDCPHGDGKISASTSHGDGEYDGQWREGQRDGQGIYRWPKTECKYTGSFYKDLRHGEGRIEWPDGANWTGSFVEDVRHGAGQQFVDVVSSGAGPSVEQKHEERWHFGVLCDRDGFAVRTVRPVVDDSEQQSDTNGD